MTATVGIVLFEGCDAIDVVGPYEVFLTANRLAVRRAADPPLVVRTFSLDGGPVTAYGGIGLVPSDGALADADGLAVLVVPGLIDLEALSDELVGEVAAAAARAPRVASVCTGAFVLEAAGLLADLDATTHWEDVALLAERRGRGSTRDDVRWVDAGRIVTSGGMTSGIAMALHLVEQVAGRPLAEATARQIDYAWTEARTS
ncbi:MAG: DJ-1/PfpI family protein [Actinobacteria bacterium]|nr:DJ-1/PfpI family protein [Actinomycetota bacterium]